MNGDMYYTSFDPTLPHPIAFSGWKHHLGYISQNTKEFCNSLDINKTNELCKGIGGSVIDLYYGKLSPMEVSIEILDYLKNANVEDIHSFKQWLANDGEGYRKVILSDESTWVLRYGRFAGRHIHIHPARYSVNTLRVKPTVIKTLIAYLLYFDTSALDIEVGQLNWVRKEVLGLPPLANGVVNHQIFTMLKYVNI
jgi:hypothetical protein